MEFPGKYEWLYDAVPAREIPFLIMLNAFGEKRLIRNVSQKDIADLEFEPESILREFECPGLSVR